MMLKFRPIWDCIRDQAIMGCSELFYPFAFDGADKNLSIHFREDGVHQIERLREKRLHLEQELLPSVLPGSCRSIEDCESALG